MSKLAVALILVATASSAYADVVEPTQESQEPAVLGPSMVQPQPILDTSFDGRPPLSGGRVVGEALLGGLFAVGGGIGGGYIGMSLELANGCNGEFCGLGGVFLGGLAGVTLAAPVGVYLAGSSGDHTASFGATLGGSAIGMLAGFVTLAASEEWVAAPLLVIGPVVGSMIGFNLTRKYDDSHRKRRTWVPVASVSSGNSTFGVAGAF
jgi:hypothetical protein